MDGMKKLTYTQNSVSNCCFVKFWGERGSTLTGLKDKIRFRDKRHFGACPSTIFKCFIITDPPKRKATLVHFSYGIVAVSTFSTCAIFMSLDIRKLLP